jgi:hypothetical protein
LDPVCVCVRLYAEVRVIAVIVYTRNPKTHTELLYYRLGKKGIPEIVSNTSIAQNFGPSF